MSNSQVGDEQAAREKWALPRRDFIALGSALIAGAAASSLSASAAVRAVASPAAGAILSVGFADFASADADAPSVQAASSLRSADAALRDGARVRVLGLTRAEANREVPVAIHLSTFASVSGAAIPFLAWSYSCGASGVSNQSANGSFFAALDDRDGLPLSVEMRSLRAPSKLFARFSSAPAPAHGAAMPNLAQLEAGGNVCRLTAGNDGDARLRAGRYFVALRGSSFDRQPDWRSIDVAADGTLRRGGGPVAFDYIALTISAPAV